MRTHYICKGEGGMEWDYLPSLARMKNLVYGIDVKVLDDIH